MRTLSESLPPIRVSAATKQRLEAIAASDDRGITYVIKLAISEFLERHPNDRLRS